MNKTLLIVIGIVCAIITTTFLITELPVKHRNLTPELLNNEEQIPEGLKTKVELSYKFIERSGKYERVLDRIYSFTYSFGHKDKFALLYPDLCATHEGYYLDCHDSNGRLIQFEEYASNDELALRRVYKYDEKTNESEVSTYVSFDGDENGELADRCYYKYNDKKQVIEYKSGNTDEGPPERISRIRYNDKGKIEEVDWYTHSYELLYKILYTYNNKGNLIEKNQHDNDVITKKWRFKYDDKNNMTECIYYEIKEESVKQIEIPISQSIYEYEFSSDLNK